MKKFVVLVLSNLLISFPLYLFAQIPLRPTPSKKTAESTQSGQNVNRSASRWNNYFPFKVKRSKDQEKRLLPNPEDLARYESFLKERRTGIFRLMSDVDCESNVYVIRVDDNCQNAIPGGSFYSFREREHTTAYLSDIRFKDGLLITDGVLSQNLLVRLGNIPLNDLSTASNGMKFLTEFVPETINTEATRQYIEIVKGIKSDKYEYRKVLPAVENMTYAVRIIAYRGSFYRNFRGWIFNLLDGDERVDMIVGFRVIRKDKDGSVTLLWKELERKKSPKLKYDKSKSRHIESKPLISSRTVAAY